MLNRPHRSQSAANSRISITSIGRRSLSAATRRLIARTDKSLLCLPLGRWVIAMVDIAHQDAFSGIASR
jgi:hypothetical protein